MAIQMKSTQALVIFHYLKWQILIDLLTFCTASKEIKGQKTKINYHWFSHSAYNMTIVLIYKKKKFPFFLFFYFVESPALLPKMVSISETPLVNTNRKIITSKNTC